VATKTRLIFSWEPKQGAKTYHLQVSANRRMSRKMTFGVAYTFGKALGTADSIYNASAIPGQVRSANYGRLAYDRTHSLVVNYTYTFPKAIRGSGMLNNPATRLLLNDWQFSGISTFRSGSPSQVGWNVTGQNLNQVITGNPDYGPRVVVNGNPATGDRSLLQWFNTGVFAPASRGSQGNDSGISYLTLPGANQTDFTLFKNVPFTHNERRYIQFRAEAYNVLNLTQWSGVNTTATFASLSSNVITNLPLGVATGTQNGGRFGFGAANAVRNVGGTAAGRVLQLALKVYF
jgi:hypothetical protein